MKNPFIITMWLVFSIGSLDIGHAQIYVGAAGADVNYDEGRIDWPRLRLDGDAGPLFTANRHVFDKANDEHKLFVGYRINRHLAVEATYHDLGQINLTRSRYVFGPNGADTADGFEVRNAADVSGPSLALLGILPFNIKKAELEVFVKAGAFSWTVDSVASQRQGILTMTAFGPSVTFLDNELALSDSASDTGISPLLGLGVVAKIYKGLAARVEVEVFGDVGEGARRSELASEENTPFGAPLTLGMKTGLSTLSAGLVYRF